MSMNDVCVTDNRAVNAERYVTGQMLMVNGGDVM